MNDECTCDVDYVVMSEKVSYCPVCSRMNISPELYPNDWIYYLDIAKTCKK